MSHITLLIAHVRIHAWARSPVWIKASAFGAGERGFKSLRARHFLGEWHAGALVASKDFFYDLWQIVEYEFSDRLLGVLLYQSVKSSVYHCERGATMEQGMDGVVY
jgi:hypothetical protein